MVLQKCYYGKLNTDGSWASIMLCYEKVELCNKILSPNELTVKDFSRNAVSHFEYMYNK